MTKTLTVTSRRYQPADAMFMEPGFSLAFFAHFEARTSEGHENANSLAHLKNIEMWKMTIRNVGQQIEKKTLS